MAPHPSISPKDYYKLIDAELPDPARMRQLLTWVAEKTRVQKKGLFWDIQQDVLNGLMNKSINTSWYHRQGNVQHPHSILGA